MKIFVDLTCLARTMTGVENYTFNLFKTVVETDQANKYCLLFRKKVHPFFRTLAKHQPECYLSLFKSQFLTEQIFIPLFLLVRKFDAHVFPCFPPGLLTRSSNLFTICYDATMWLYPDTTSLKNRLYFKPLTERALRKAQKIFTISESSKRDISHVFAFLANRIVNIGAALPDGFTPVQEKEAHSANADLGIKEPYLLSVGSLEPRKNILFALRALEPVLKEKNIRLVLVGRNAWGTDEISHEIMNLSLDRYVLRTGFVSKKQLQFLYSKAEIFIFPSLYEGFGFPIVEAFSCGCPVISSNTSSIPEVAGNAALLIDPHNGAQLRDAVLSLLANQSRREELRLRGYKQVMKFNWADCAARLLEQVNRSR